MPRLTLAGLETRVDLIDHVDPTLAANDAACPVTGLERFQRALDFHDVAAAGAFRTG
jgi:hypothetical protein